MSDEKQEKLKPVFIMVPRKLVITLAIAFACMMIMTISSIQWANYVDRRSNQRWCGIVELFDSNYTKSPPPTDLGKQIAAEFRILRNQFDCN